MNLIKFTHRWDYGHDWYVQSLSNSRWSFFQGSLSWGHYPGWPYLQIKFGYGSMISVNFSAYKFGCSFGFIERTWRLN